MQRGIEQADGDRVALHRLEDALKVAALHGQDLVERALALLLGARDDHLAHGGDAVVGEEHVLGAGQADALRAEVEGHAGIVGVVRVGAHAEVAVFVRPLHNGGKLARDGGVLGGDLAEVDVAGVAVDGEEVALLDHMAVNRHDLALLVDLQRAAAGDAAAAHAAGHDRRVRGAPAAAGQHALGDLHAHDVLGGGL